MISPRDIHALFRRIFGPPKPLRGRGFVLDGSNITLLRGRAKPDLRYVLALCDYLRSNGAQAECFFDANMAYVLREHRPEQVTVFEAMVGNARAAPCFRVVPSRTQADPHILARAKQAGWDVISNDRFRDRAKDNPWIWKRRHNICVEDERVLIASLEADVEVLSSTGAYLARRLL